MLLVFVIDLCMFFDLLSDLLISAFESEFIVLTFNSISTVGVADVSTSDFLLKTLFKCSSYIDICSASLFTVLPLFFVF